MAGPHAEVMGEAGGVLEEGLAFADGADHGVGGEGEEFTEAPDAGMVEWEAAVLPAGFEVFEGLGDGGLVPVVDDVQELAALGTGGERLGDVVGGLTIGVNTLLVCDVFHRLGL